MALVSVYLATHYVRYVQCLTVWTEAEAHYVVYIVYLFVMGQVSVPGTSGGK